MRVVYIITRSDAIGGAHVHVRDLAARLLAEGHSVQILVGGEGPFTRQLSDRGIPFTNVPSLVRAISPWDDLQAFLHMRRILSSLKPDLVSTHSSKAGWLGRAASRSLGIPAIFTAHGWAFTDGVPEKQRRLYVLAEKLAARFGDHIITVSSFDKELARAHGVAPETKMIPIHNGMPDVPSELLAQPESEPPHMIMVARFEEQKDHATLLAALAQLKQFSWTLELIGDGPLRPAVERLAEGLGIRNRIEFVGAVDDVAERLARAQIFVLTSRWEGFPRSILEAMRAGLPVVASDVGGVAESVADAINGYLVPRGDVFAVKERLQRLLIDPDLRIGMGRRARQRFEKEFTFDRMFEKTISVYRDVLGKLQPPSAGSG